MLRYLVPRPTAVVIRVQSQLGELGDAKYLDVLRILTRRNYVNIVIRKILLDLSETF